MPITPTDAIDARLDAATTTVLSAFETDALGGPDGSFRAVAMEPQADGTVRLSARPRPPVDGPGIRFE